MTAQRPRGALLALCSGAALLFTAFFMTGTLAPLLAGALEAPPATIGVVISAAFLFPFFLAIPAGSLVDAVGPKPMLLVGTALLALAPAWVAVAPSLPSLIAVQVAAGLGQLIAVVAAQSLVASLGEGREREGNFGWYGAFVSGGQLAGPVLAGVLVDLTGFRAAYLVAALAAAAGVATFAVLRAPGRRSDAASRRRAAFVRPGTLLAIARLPTAQVSLWVSGTVMIVLIGHNSFLPAFLDGLAIPASVIGVVISARSAASVLIRPFMAATVRAFGGRLRTFLVTIAASAAGVAGIAAAPNLAALLASSLLLGLAVGVAQPLTMVAMVEEVAVASHGVAFGTRITANRLVQFVAPLAMGLVAQALGYAAMFLVAAAVVAVTAVGLAALRRRYRAIDGASG